MVFRRPLVLDSESDADGGPLAPRRDTLRFTAHDTLYLLHYMQLGSWSWWYHGQASDGMEFWHGPPEIGVGATSGHPAPDSATAVALSQPRTEAWWYVVPPHGGAGWAPHTERLGLESVNALRHEGVTCADLRKAEAERTAGG